MCAGCAAISKALSIASLSTLAEIWVRRVAATASRLLQVSSNASNLDRVVASVANSCVPSF